MIARSVKASGSPTLPSQPKPGSSQAPIGTPVRPKPNQKNTIPVILSGVNEEFRNWRKLMGELRQSPPQSPNFTNQGVIKRRFSNHWGLSAGHNNSAK